MKRLFKYIKKVINDVIFYIGFYAYEKPMFLLWKMRNKSNSVRLACVKPFIDIEIDQNGDCYLCCKSWMPFSVGNVHASRIEDIFNSAKSQSVRMSMYTGNMKYCNKNLCNIVNSRNHKYIAAENLHDCVFGDDGFASSISGRKLEMPSPCMITETISEKCNIKCKFCWTPYAAKQTNTRALTVFAEYVKNNIDIIKMVSFCGGEPLIQKHVVDILSAAQHKSVKFYFTSNLNCLSDEIKFLLKNINIELFHVSLNAVRSITYDNVVSGGNWPMVVENLNFLLELRRKYVPNMKIQISMVVTNRNYLDIPDFAKFGVNKMVDKIIFYPMNEYGYAEQKLLQIGQQECHEIDGLLRDEVFSVNSKMIEVEALRRFVHHRVAVNNRRHRVAH